jgi:virginiamycin B lyase
MIRARSRVPLLLAAVLLLGLAFAPGAAGSIYWANDKGTTIGTANLDGTGVDQSFITGASNPCGVAVDAAHLYWGNNALTGTIGRSSLDGTGVNQGFITGGSNPCGVAIDAGHL